MVTAESVLAVLEKQTFYDWYNSDFKDHIEAVPEGKDAQADLQEKVLRRIEQMFGVKRAGPRRKLKGDK